MADKRATLTLKFGDQEVRYEAEREAVEAQLKHILDRFLPDAAAEVQVGLTDARPKSAQHRPAAVPAAEKPPTAAPEAVSEAQRLAQLYAVTDGGSLRLRKLPGRVADALLLVLYGMWKLQDRAWVHAPGMTNAARASGARFERADRLLAGYQDLIEGFGKRRAKRYRLTAAGRQHCSRLVADLAGPIATGGGRQVAADAERAAGEPERTTAAENAAENAAGAADEAGIPAKVTARWDGEVLSVSETARRLGVDEAEIGKLRRGWALLGLPGGDRRRRRHFYPAFQIDPARHEIYPQVREANQLVGPGYTSWDLASWWSRSSASSAGDP